MEGREIYTLGNKLRVAIQRTPTKTFVGRLRINFGAYHELENEKGLAHFLEHCIVRAGSEKYSSQEARKIYEEFQEYNATTSLGRTTFDIRSVSGGIEQWLSLVSDSVFHPSLNADYVESERARILREMEGSRNTDKYGMSVKFAKAIYRSHPKSDIYTIDGSRELVLKASVSDLRNFHKRGYSASNAELLLAGSLPENISELVKKYFEHEEEGIETRIDFPRPDPLEKAVIMYFPLPGASKQEGGEPLSVIDLAFLSPSPEDNDFFASYFLGKMLKKKLHERLSDKEGLCYYVQIAEDSRYNASHMVIQTSVPSQKLEKSLECIFSEMDKLKAGIGKEEVRSMKRKTEFEVLEVLESNSGQMDWLGAYFDYGATPDSVFEKLERVDENAVAEAARKHLPDSSRKNTGYVLSIKDPLLEK